MANGRQAVLLCELHMPEYYVGLFNIDQTRLWGQHEVTI